MQELAGVPALQPTRALPAICADGGAVPEQRLGERRVSHGDVCSRGQELRAADCAAPQANACMQQPVPGSSLGRFLRYSRESREFLRNLDNTYGALQLAMVLIQGIAKSWKWYALLESVSLRSINKLS